MVQLRNYQETSIANIKERFRQGDKRTILCLPTGAGKTVTFSALAKRTIDKNPQSRVLILTDRIELLSQAGGTLYTIGLSVGVLSAKAKHMPRERVVVAMVETYYKRVKKGWKLPGLSLIIVDEAHKGNFRKIFQMHPDIHTIGATATPIATSRKDPLKNYFNSIVVGTEIGELVQDGYLSKPRYFAVKMDITAGTGADGDYKTGELYKDYNKSELYAGCVKNHQKHAAGQKTVVFCVNIEHSEQTAKSFLEVTPNVRVITSFTPEEQRKGTLRWFSKTEGAILVNCGILTTGFDEPTIECVILNRATKSLPLYLQMCGRGSRTTSTKENFTIIDMGNNISNHGFWHEPRDWERMFLHPKKPRESAPGVKECPHCEALLATWISVCTHCGYEYPPPPPKELIEAEVEELTVDWNYLYKKNWNKMSIHELIKRAELGNQETKKPYKMGWIIRQLWERENGEQLIKEFAQIKGYAEGWVNHQLTKLKNEALAH